VSVVWATSEARRADWAWHGLIAAAGRLHTITSRESLVLHKRVTLVNINLGRWIDRLLFFNKHAAW
jgi:hypothetical protein